MELSITAIRDHLADALNRVTYGGERVILKRRGNSVAALVSMEDLAHLEEWENQADLKAALMARKEKRGITLDDYKKMPRLQSRPRQGSQPLAGG
jgi:prevent-host-death family protein